ncbi:155_t:CDS:2 [Ambispora gerdemannii]|uniref:155_t:CDS:1 n=1 Tax=Ambispora gerdemannii TaxID=144530 RepID=A0A9N9A4F2_9GLOM|nr:155_t:CDS:2 [Ambispora gerdemannii]
MEEDISPPSTIPMTTTITNSATHDGNITKNFEQRNSDNKEEFLAPKSEPLGSFHISSKNDNTTITTISSSSPTPNVNDNRSENIKKDQTITVTTSSPTSVSPTTSTLANISLNPNMSSNHKTQAAFVNKLYTMVEDQSIQHLISWAPSGDVFSVSNPTEFSKTVLPQYFKHNNWQSFVRQLNINDMFHANPSSESQAWEFKHPEFRRGQLAALQNIKRKSAKQQTQTNQIMIKGGGGSVGGGMSGSASSLSPTEGTNLADMIHDDRIDRLSTQMAEMMENMRRINESYSLLVTETVSCKMLQAKHTQVIANMTNLLASICRDESDPRILRKRKFDVDLLQAEVAKLGQNETILTSPHSQHPPMQYSSGVSGNREHNIHHPGSHVTPMIGIENTGNSSNLHHHHYNHATDPDYRQSSSAPATSQHRSSKIQSSTSPLAILPEFGFPPYYSHNNTNYLRVHPSPESGGQNGGGTVLGNNGGSRSGGDQRRLLLLTVAQRTI